MISSCNFIRRNAINKRGSNDDLTGRARVKRTEKCHFEKVKLNK